MGEAKRRKDALLNSDKWIYFSSEIYDPACGKLTTLANAIAERLSLQQITKSDIPVFIAGQVITILNESNPLKWRNKKHSVYNQIVNECLQKRSFKFNHIYVGNELIHYEEIKYCPNRDTRYDVHWD